MGQVVKRRIPTLRAQSADLNPTENMCGEVFTRRKSNLEQPERLTKQEQAGIAKEISVIFADNTS